MKKIILIVVLIIFILLIFVFGIGELTRIIPNKTISGIENYNKSYYIKEYGGDLDSNLAIFPNNKDLLIKANFESSFQTNLFDSDGYIILNAKYREEDFNSEIERLKDLKIVIRSSCLANASLYENKIKYDELSYIYPAYITIDGFGHTYEYALINRDNLEITYVYLAYPDNNNSKYEKYLKIDKLEYSTSNTISLYSMYNHSFDNGNSYAEFDDCN